MGKEIKIEGNKPKKRWKAATKLKVGLAICEEYAKNENTIDSICKAYGVEFQTFAGWAGLKQANGLVAEIAEAYKNAKEKANETYLTNLKAKARTSLQKKVEGFEYEEKTTEVKVDAKGDATPVSIKTTKKFIPPSDTAIIFALKNVDEAHFSDKTTTKHEGSVQVGSFKDLTDDELSKRIANLSQSLEQHTKAKKK